MMLDVLVPCSSLFHASVPLWLKSFPNSSFPYALW